MRVRDQQTSAPHATRHPVALFIGLMLFAGWVFSSRFFGTGTIYWDNLSHYSFFHDNLHSLNEFSEPAWWFPHNQLGFPAYYFSILGPLNASTPPFMLLAAFSWLLGVLGIHMTNFLPLYYFYFAVLVPGMVLLGVWLVARQLFRSHYVIGYVMIIASFSPGVHFNISDLGNLEHVAYCLFFVAAYLLFIRHPNQRNSAVLACTVLLLSLAANYSTLMFTVWFLPLFVLVSLFPKRARSRIRLAFAQVRFGQWVLITVLAIGCASPVLVTLTQIRDLQRVLNPHAGLRYSKMNLRPGNPLEPLSASTPGVGFDWDRGWGDPRGEYRPVKLEQSPTYTYLGILCLPLAFVGLLFGRWWLRVRLAVLLMISFCIMLMSVASPPLDVLLSIPSPLLSMSHFSDGTYRGGGFLFWIFLAGLGLETLERRGRGVSPMTLGLFAITTAVSIGSYLHLYRGDACGAMFGFFVLTAALCLLVLIGLFRSTLVIHRRVLLGLLLGLTLLDVSTFSFWKIRLITTQPELARAWDTPGPNHIGLAELRANTTADTCLRFDSLTKLIQDDLPLRSLPPAALFATAYACSERLTRTDFEHAITGPFSSRSLALQGDAMQNAAFRSIMQPPPLRSLTNNDVAQQSEFGSIRLLSMTYTTMRLQVDSPRPACLFLRSAYSRHWSATVDGAFAPIARALGHFQAVPVSAGRSEVVFRFHPPFIGITLVIAYGSLLGTVGWMVYLHRSRSAAKVKPSRPS